MIMMRKGRGEAWSLSVPFASNRSIALIGWGDSRIECLIHRTEEVKTIVHQLPLIERGQGGGGGY